MIEEFISGVDLFEKVAMERQNGAMIIPMAKPQPGG